jgi:HAD superfamily hydrolase (TIGR01549 family)
MGRYIDRFDAILLDMGNTFMFGCDRFDEDVGATYADLGGSLLGPGQVREALQSLFDSMLPIARSSDRYDSFPRVCDQLGQLVATRDLPIGERDVLEQTFALHEVGQIPRGHAETLRQLRQTHRLGLVSNVWSAPGVFLDEFRRVGVDGLFDAIVFSSDHGSIKPSPKLFDIALQRMPCERSRVVYVGDKLHRDVAGAKAASVASIWVNRARSPRPKDTPEPDLEVQCISELLIV